MSKISGIDKRAQSRSDCIGKVASETTRQFARNKNYTTTIKNSSNSPQELHGSYFCVAELVKG